VGYFNHDSVVTAPGFPVSTKFGPGVTDSVNPSSGIVSIELLEWKATLHMHTSEIFGSCLHSQ